MSQPAERETTERDATPAQVGTPEGRQRARRLLDEGRARMSDADWSDLQQRFGRRTRTAA